MSRPQAFSSPRYGATAWRGVALAALACCLAPSLAKEPPGAMDPQPPIFEYAIVDHGYEATNGPGIYNRPLYGPHCRDLASFDERLIAIVGDSPDALMLWMNWRVPGGGGCSAAKLGHLMLGIRSGDGGKWLRDFATIKARYALGHQQYELSDPTVHGSVGLAYVRPVEFEGLLVRVDLPAGLTANDLIFACGGATEWVGHLDYQGGKASPKDFHPEECRGSQVSVDGGHFAVRRPNEGHRATLYGAASLPLKLAVGDAAAVAEGPAKLLASRASEEPMAVGAGTGPARRVFLVLTTDDLSLPAIGAYLADPAPTFDAACGHYAKLSQTVRIDTPDEHLNLGFPAQTLGLDGAWHDPCFTHGPWSWASPYAGWRVCYGPTVLGWHSRVQSSTAEFFADQVKEPEMPSPQWTPPSGYPGGHISRGAVPDLARNRSYFYNMGEVLVDHILYDWQWTGDLAFMEEAFDFIADKLLWEERCLDPDGDGLHENWLNTWVSDAHWYNGSGCIQASVYNWRANAVMADIAPRLGRDPAVFRERGERIRRACDGRLWVADQGVYAEYEDALGLRRLHTAPEQASIYHPIDFGFPSAAQSYQMLRYAEYAMRNDIVPGPRGGRLIWSSNWEPPLYSSLGIYPQETINLLLCYYRLGLTEKADELLRGVEASFVRGPCPGGIAHNQRPDGTHFGSTDFTDTSSMFVRTVVEGLFGIRMDVPHGRVTVQPGFPREWRHAEIQAADLGYLYALDGHKERLEITTLRKLAYEVRLLARRAEVRGARVNGAPVEFRLEPGIGGAWVVVETPATGSASVEVTYGEAPLPRLDFAPAAAIGEDYTFRVRDGRIVRIDDPQGVLGDVRVADARCTARVKGQAGWHTFFVLAASGEVRAWLPVDVELRPPLELVSPQLVIHGGKVRCTAVLRNNGERERHVAGQLRIAGTSAPLDVVLPARGTSPELAVDIADPSRLSPGTNTLSVADTAGAELARADVVDWGLASKLPAVSEPAAAARPVPLGGLLNQELLTLHDQKYDRPRPATYSIMVCQNGRSLWDWNANGYCIVKPRIDRLQGTGGRFVSDIGVPFAVPETGANACFVSLWENFPPRVTVPIGARGSKLYFLLAVSTNPMQSRIGNARITVHLADGAQRVLPLTNPENLDDWLCDPFALSGFPQPLGEKTHALILDLDLGAEADIASLDLECLANEVLVGLLGVTVR